MPFDKTLPTLEQIRLTLKPIKTEAQYRRYLTIIDGLVDCPEGSPEEEILELVSLLVEVYETEHYHIDPPDPIEAIKLKMEEEGLKRKDLAPYLGSPSRVTEVLNRKRPLSLDMIRKLHQGLGLSYDTLLAM